MKTQEMVEFQNDSRHGVKIMLRDYDTHEVYSVRIGGMWLIEMRSKPRLACFIGGLFGGGLVSAALFKTLEFLW